MGTIKAEDFQHPSASNANISLASGGNVGIGTNTPGTKLMVYNSTGASLSLNSAGTGTSLMSGLQLQVGSSGEGYLFNYSNSFMSFGTNNIERMRINSSGNVGIGTNAPAEKLDVAGNASISGVLGVSAGTVSAPSITTAGDPNTGIYFPAADTMAFVEGGAEAMRINSSGQVGVNASLGIGTTSPTQRLDVFRNAADYSTMTIRNTVSSLDMAISGAGDAQIIQTGNFPLQFVTNNIERLRMTGSGEVWIAGFTDRGSFNLQCNGTGVWGAGAYNNGSDSRIKEDVSPITSGLDVIQKMNPVKFRYIESWSKDRSMQPGFIAQELQQALAGQDYLEGVVHNGPEYLSVAYQTIIPLLVKAVQELKTQNDELKSRVEALEAK